MHKKPVPKDYQNMEFFLKVLLKSMRNFINIIARINLTYSLGNFKVIYKLKKISFVETSSVYQFNLGLFKY